MEKSSGYDDDGDDDVSVDGVCVCVELVKQVMIELCSI